MSGLARQAGRGFSLVEVLVAVAIVAIALAAGGRAAGALLDNSQRLSDVSAAQWCAENHMVNLKLTRYFPDVGESNTVCKQLGREYKLKVLVRPSFNPNFRIVDAGVANAQDVPLVRLSAIIPRY
ncbi:MAG: type II secretion system protein GspI [Ideonella sp. MAG2]|nr:MAG: type II secretion system protein GspI [Ideonella sp. MAG2]